MKIYFLLSMLILSTSVFSEDNIPESNKRDSFNQAYDLYQKLIGEPGSPEVDGKLLKAAQDAYFNGRDIFGDKSKNTALLAKNYAWVLGRVGQGDKGRAILIESIPVFGAAFGENSEEYLLVHIDIVEFSGYGTEEAISYARRAEQLGKKLYGENSIAYADTLFVLGRELDVKNFEDLAESYLMSAKSIFISHYGEDHVRVASTNYLLGRMYSIEEQYTKAIPLLKEAIDMFEKIGEEGFDPARRAHEVIVDTYYEMKEPEKATPHCVAIGKINEKLGVVEPQLLYMKPVETPQYVLRKGLSGEVTVGYQINEEGFVIDAKIIKSNGKVFEKAALESVRGRRFSPKVINGIPVLATNQKTDVRLGKEAIFEVLDILKEHAIPKEDQDNQTDTHN